MTGDLGQLPALGNLRSTPRRAAPDPTPMAFTIDMAWTIVMSSGRTRSHGIYITCSVLGSLTQGLPTFAVPWITYSDIVPVLIGGGAVALISFADTSVLSRTYAARLGTKVDPNQEMVGLGAANLAAGFFHGFPISSSSSRTPVAGAAGAHTQLSGVVGALAVALILSLAPTVLRHLHMPPWPPS